MDANTSLNSDCPSLYILIDADICSGKPQDVSRCARLAILMKNYKKVESSTYN